MTNSIIINFIQHHLFHLSLFIFIHIIQRHPGWSTFIKCNQCSAFYPTLSLASHSSFSHYSIPKFHPPLSFQFLPSISLSPPLPFSGSPIGWRCWAEETRESQFTCGPAHRGQQKGGASELWRAEFPNVALCRTHPLTHQWPYKRNEREGSFSSEDSNFPTKTLIHQNVHPLIRQ